MDRIREIALKLRFSSPLTSLFRDYSVRKTLYLTFTLRFICFYPPTCSEDSDRGRLKFYHVDLMDLDKLDAIFQENPSIHSVIHLAGLKVRSIYTHPTFPRPIY